MTRQVTRLVVIGIDPGKKTGIAVWNRSLDHYVTELDPRDTSDFLRSTLIKYNGPQDWEVLVSMERFFINAQTHKKSRQADAVNIIGYVHDLCRTFNITLVQNPASLAKRYTDTLLRRIGLYTVAHRHGNDAMRHVLVGLLQHRPDELARLLERGTI